MTPPNFGRAFIRHSGQRHVSGRSKRDGRLQTMSRSPISHPARENGPRKMQPAIPDASLQSNSKLSFIPSIQKNTYSQLNNEIAAKQLGFKWQIHQNVIILVKTSFCVWWKACDVCIMYRRRPLTCTVEDAMDQLRLAVPCLTARQPTPINYALIPRNAASSRPGLVFSCIQMHLGALKTSTCPFQERRRDEPPFFLSRYNNCLIHTHTVPTIESTAYQHCYVKRDKNATDLMQALDSGIFLLKKPTTLLGASNRW